MKNCSQSGNFQIKQFLLWSKQWICMNKLILIWNLRWEFFPPHSKLPIAHLPIKWLDLKCEISQSKSKCERTFMISSKYFIEILKLLLVKEVEPYE